VRCDITVVDSEPVELRADEATERVVADAGDQCRRISQTSCRDGHVGSTAAEELAERFHLFQTDTDLQWVDVDATAADGQHVERL